ncbi:MAG: beta-glucosidase BglX [Cyclobacteriaceae bacterium]|nr:beta-glucosidase BglX [Cyclobacteriaceae bacterium]MCH8515138.1 beta-glucosidase BglX [Cyclobacteriaceae bacterium]
MTSLSICKFSTLFTLLLITPFLGRTQDRNITSKVDSLLSIMTLDEKIGQLNQYSVGAELTGPGSKEGQDSIRYEHLKNGQVGSVLNLVGAKETADLQRFVMENSRLKIPMLFAYDVIHGYKTMFPIPLGESASWNLELMQETAAAAAKEAAAAGIHWTFAPMIDVSVDPRWGRVMEGGGEDPYLNSVIGVARIKGFQGESLSDPFTIAACAKHFAGYGYGEAGMDYNNVIVNRETLLNQIIPPFKAAADAGVATFMNAFNDIDGIPSTANQYLQRKLLRGDWGFEGVMVSDWNSIGEIMSHGVAKDLKDAARQAILAGSDIDMEASAYVNHLKELVEEGTVSIDLIDEAVRRVLYLKYELGLFDNPYAYSDEAREKEVILSEEMMALSKRAALESMVLLKNENQLLPLDPSKKTAVIGPLAKDKDSPLGNWRAKAESNSAVSLWEALEKRNFKALTHEEGCKLSVGKNNFFEVLTIEEEDRSSFASAIEAAKSSEQVIMVLGETAFMSGEGRSRSSIELAGLQKELLKAVYEVNQNIVLVLMNGRPLALSWEDEHIPAILETWHLGHMGAEAIADVLLGEYNPHGKLPISFPRATGQIPVQYNHKTTGRPNTQGGQVFFTHHNDIERTALYPFGFGLSYSTFEYSDFKINATEMTASGSIKASIVVKNSSDIDGYEVVQLYLQDVVGSVTRPVKELKGFERVKLKAGESKTISFEITEDQLKFYRANETFGSEPGEFRVFIGPHSAIDEYLSFELIDDRLKN